MFLDNLFNRRRAEPPPPPELETLDRPPDDANWVQVRPRGEERVRAWVAKEDCEVVTGAGVLHARKGHDVIVAYGPRDLSVVSKGIFNRTYKRVSHGQFRKRTDVKLRYFTLDRPVMIETREGMQRAEPGDWIMEGLEGELWPVPREKAPRKYELLGRPH